MTADVYWHSHPVTHETRAELKQQEPLVIWFTGFSASGKSTIAGALEQILAQQGYHTYLLDGDNVRHGLCADLGFGDEDRKENIRRVGQVASLMADAGLITLTAFISPFQADRDLVRSMLPKGRFVEVFVNTSIERCRERDPKGLYAKADRGEIRRFTGIDSPYEAPTNAEVVIDGDNSSIPMAVNQLLAWLDSAGALKAGYEPVAMEA